MERLVRSGIGLLAAAALGAGVVTATAGIGGQVATAPGNGNGLGDQPTTISEVYQDPISDYGVCRGVDPICYNDWGNGWEEGDDAPRILIWSHTPGPRHAHLGDRLGEGLNPPLNETNVAQAALVEWAAERGIEADYTEDLGSFSRLNNYNAVVFLSANRDTLDDTAQTNLKQFVRRGGGFVGIHNAFGAEYHWPWYEGLLGGANFYDHAPNRDGTVETINGNDVSTEFMPEEWDFKDEWYNLVPYPSYVNVLLEVDEETSLNGRDSGHPGHGEEHAVSWCHYYDGGRAFLTTLGHNVDVWSGGATNDAFFEEHVMAGLESAIGMQPFCTL